LLWPTWLSTQSATFSSQLSGLITIISCATRRRRRPA
jgi:hypothetical protein